MDTIETSPDTGANLPASDKTGGTRKGIASSAGRAAEHGTSPAAGKVDRFRDEATPALDKAAAETQELGPDGMDALADVSRQLRERALQASDAAAAYAREEPVKALLIAAASGALLMVLLTMMVRSDY